MFKNPLLLLALTLTGLVAIWGIIDPTGLAQFSSTLTDVLFTSRAWFIMLAVSLLLIFVLLTGPTYYIMSAITGSIGDYFARVVPHGFKTHTFFDEKVTNNWPCRFTFCFYRDLGGGLSTKSA